MKQPLGVPVMTGESKIVFCTEGNSIALLLIHRGGRHRTRNLKFESPEQALGWCRQRSLMMVYCPRDPSAN
jgi:hypothetical protein